MWYLKWYLIYTRQDRCLVVWSQSFFVACGARAIFFFSEAPRTAEFFFACSKQNKKNVACGALIEKFCRLLRRADRIFSRLRRTRAEPVVDTFPGPG